MGLGDPHVRHELTGVHNGVELDERVRENLEACLETRLVLHSGTTLDINDVETVAFVKGGGENVSVFISRHGEYNVGVGRDAIVVARGGEHRCSIDGSQVRGACDANEVVGVCSSCIERCSVDVVGSGLITIKGGTALALVVEREDSAELVEVDRNGATCAKWRELPSISTRDYLLGCPWIIVDGTDKRSRIENICLI